MVYGYTIQTFIWQVCFVLKQFNGGMKRYFSKQAIKDGFTILKAAFNGFMNDLALKYSASLAFYTYFRWPPCCC